MTAAPFVATTLPERPYPGLRPFDASEWRIFFGRERMIDDVIGRLAESRLVLIHGVSGSGKSSLVRAGVLPKLALQYRRHGAPWLTCAMRPSGGPLWNLAAEFAKLERRERDLERISEISALFSGQSATLASVAATLEKVEGKSLCILVDQFEELFRYEEETSRDEAELFVSLIERAATENVAHSEQDASARQAAREDGAEGKVDAVDVHVILTMRSEFLGECSRFEGFAETINRTQYLVPRTDDEGLLRAVRRPVQMYGGEFDEALAERLIGSVRGREDELPLLQHGLTLMWGDAVVRAGEGRRPVLDGRIVDEAGGLAVLLSRHADEVMAKAVPDQRGEKIVEAVFRALTDVNAEGSEIRRPLAFQTLCAETGAGSDEIRPMLDAFRASDVLFLTPHAPKPIDDKTIIDISHEALIRCWGKIGKIGQKPDGWLQNEVREGLGWRLLLFQAESFAENPTNVLSEPATDLGERRLKERNAAWAERYGDGWPKVVALVDASREHWRRQRDIAAASEAEGRRNRKRRRLAFAVVAQILILTVLGAVYRERAQHLDLAAQHQRQAAVDKSAMLTAKTLLEGVLSAYNTRSLDFVGADALATISGQFLERVRDSAKTSAADLLWAQALNVDSDLQATLNKNEEALALARKAKEVALSLTQADPNAQEPLQVLYDASIRVGNALAALGFAHYSDALGEYEAAEAVGKKITSLGNDETGESDLIDVNLKIGDLFSVERKYSEARERYLAALAAADAAISKHNNNVNLLGDKARVLFRVGDLLRREKVFEEARTAFGAAAEVQQSLILQDPQNFSLKSNLAATYARWGTLERDAGYLDIALAKLEQAAALDQELISTQPGNPRLEDYVAPVYASIAEILSQLNRPNDALQYFQQYFKARRALAFPGTGSARARSNFADAAKLLGDHSAGLARIDAYRTATRTWSELVNDPGAADAVAKRYDAVLEIARVFEATKDWPDSQYAYLLASRMAHFNFAKDPSNTSWREKAEAAEKAAVEAHAVATSTDAPGQR